MADDSIDLPSLRIPVVADASGVIDARARAFLKQGAEEAGADFSNRFSQTTRRAKLYFGVKDAATKEARDAGVEAAKRLKEGLRRELADIRELRFRNIISPEEAERQGREAGKRMNDALLEEIRVLGESGKLSDRGFIRLAESLREEGVRGGRAFGDGVDREGRGGIDRLSNYARTAFRFLIAGTLVYTLRRIAQGIGDFLVRGGEVNTVANGFDNLTGSVNETSEAILSGLRRATQGVVADSELMVRATTAIQAKLPVTAQSLERLAYLSRRLAEAAGRDATDGFNRFVSGIAKGEQNLLEEIGILTRMEDALRSWTQETGRSTDSLTGQQKTLIYYNAVLAEAETKVGALGDETVTAGTRVQQFTTFVRNLTDETARLVANSPALSSFFAGLAGDAETSADRVDNLSARIAAFIEVAANAGRIIGSATFANPADWSGEYNAALQRISQDQEADAWVRRVRAETDVNKLLADRQRIQRSMAALNLGGAEGMSEKAMADWERHNRILKEIDRRRRDLANPAEPTPTATAALTKAEVDRIATARESLEVRIREFRLLQDAGVPALDERATELPALLQQVISLDREIAAIEKEIAATRGQAPEGARALLQAYRDQREAAAEAARAISQGAAANMERLDTLRAGIVRIIDVSGDLAGPAVDSAGGWVTLTGQIDGVTRATREATEAEEALQAAYRSGDRGRIVAAEKGVKEAREAVAKATAAAQRALEAGLKRGTISQARYNELVRELVALLRAAGIEAKDLADDAGGGWEDLAGTVEGLARGVLSVADAMGVLDNESRRALQGVVDVADAVAKLAKNPGDIGAWFQAAGGVAGIISGLFGKNDEERRQAMEAHARQLDSVHRLVRALDELRSAVLTNLSAREKESIESAGRNVFAERGTWFDSVQAEAEKGTNSGRVRWKMSQEEFDFFTALEEATDIDFFDPDKMEIWIEGLNDAWAIFQELDIGSFGNDLMGRLDALDYVAQVAGDAIGDAAAQWKMFIAELLKFPESQAFAEELQRTFTEGGPEAVREWLQKQAVLFAQGGTGALSWAGDLTGPEVQRIIDEALERTETGSSSGSADSYQQSRTITEVTGFRLFGVLQTANLFHEQTARNTAAIAAALGARGLPSPGSVTPPSVSSGSGGDTYHLHFGEGSLQVDVDVSGPVADPAAAGVALGRSFVQAVDEGLHQKAQAARRRQGYNRA